MLIFVLFAISGSVVYTLNYTINEELPVGTTIGNFCSDLLLDCSQYPQFSFFNKYLSSDISGDITIIERIDYDGDQLDLENGMIIGFIKLLNKSNEKTVINLRVKILDINDNVPMFPLNEVYLNTSSLYAGVLINLPKAEDKDIEEIIQYSLIGSSEFTLIETDSNLIINCTSNVDSQQTQINLRIIAIDNYNLAHLTYMNLRIFINSKYTKFSQFYVVTQNSTLTKGAKIVKMSETEEYIVKNGKALFSMKGVNDKYVVEKEGQITTGNNAEISDDLLTIVVKNKKNSLKCYFSVQITNIYNLTQNITLSWKNGSPTFTISSSTVDIGQLTVTPNSTDADCKINSNAVDLKRVGDNSFNLSLLKYSQITPVGLVNITCVPIQKHDCSSTWYRGQREFIETLTITDEKTTKKPPILQIYENMPIGTFVDVEINQRCKIETNDFFRLDSFKNCCLESLKIIDYEEIKEIQIQIETRVSGVPNIANKTIKVLDNNDHAPIFVNTTFGYYIMTNATNGSSLFSVNAEDGDTGTDAKISYDITSVSDLSEINSCPAENNRDKIFSIDNDSGMVAINGNLQNSSVYQITIRATDYGAQKLFSDLNCFVRVMNLENMFKYIYFGSPIKSGDTLNSYNFKVGNVIMNTADFKSNEITDMTYSVQNESLEYFKFDNLTGSLKIMKIPKKFQIKIEFSSQIYPTFKYFFEINVAYQPPTTTSITTTEVPNSKTTMNGSTRRESNTSKSGLSKTEIILIATITAIVILIALVVAYIIYKKKNKDSETIYEYQNTEYITNENF